jgi:glucosamine 6-phosphate synthetase-like amidotransferase/phosphosugar isomerase protein
LPLTIKYCEWPTEIVVLRAGGAELYRVEDSAPVTRQPEIITESMEAAQKGGYAHFLLKEIHEEPQVAAELFHLLERSAEVQAIVEQMQSARNVYLVGCGTSYHACLLGSIYLARLAGRVAIPVLATQFIAQYVPALSSEDMGIFVSQSGETKDVLNAVEAAQRQRAGIFGLVNVNRLYPDAPQPALPAARLRLRDQCAGHQDVYQPGGRLPVPGLAVGRPGYRGPFWPAGPDASDPRRG